jgi:preprotein translocase subunit SecF
LGLPAELSDFLTIWAIGTILGVITRYVDMRFTWEYDRARLQVLLLDLVLIPNSINVVIEESVYELHF